ncbi:MAG: polysaccharide deacetylase family protein [Candidatus Saccharibacteria bacterium]|nr:polysaccharide deacetylase family protein [Candidatus Saccharibacteria bacterium]
MKIASFIKNKVASVFAAGIVLGSGTIAMPLRAQAAVTNPTPKAKVSFTFDDGLQSAITQAAPTLAKYGYTGTNYVTTGCIGMTTTQNTCRADSDLPYMSWAQVQALQNTYKWEIGSHTVSHPLLASTDPQDQPRKLTTAQVTAELANSKSALAAQGINAVSFAAPYGDYDMPVLSQIAKYYSSARGFADTGYNTWPNSDYILRTQQVQAGVSVATVKSYIDTAIANNQWLILTFHEIRTNASTNPDDYQYNTADLDAIAAYIKSKNVSVVNVKDGIMTSDTNLLPNSSFNNGISDGWSTDAPTQITKNTAANGSFPDATNSIRFVGTTKATHLFSPKVAVSYGTNYALKNYIRVQKINTGGEFGFYVDEYDINGNWISGQYKGAERSVFVESFNFAYSPTSSRVATARLQVFTTANSGVTAFLDNSQWFATSQAATPPATTNLVTNGTFDAGISGGWTTSSPSTITADVLNNGSPANPVNSVKAVSSSANTYLFSPLVAVDSTKNYSLSTYVKLQAIVSGEVGFYIDEYDANGNWISGQYKSGARSIGSADVTFSYAPSSAAVKQASLQIIIVGNSGITTYLDNVRWLAL